MNMALTAGFKGNSSMKRHTKERIKNSRALEAQLTREAWETWTPAETIRQGLLLLRRGFVLSAAALKHLNLLILL